MKAITSKEMDELHSFLKKEELDVKTAISILKKSTQTNPGNFRSLWKMMRFTLYIWQRHKEYKANMLGTKIESIRRVVATDKYKRLWATHKQTGKFNEAKEVKNLNLLITDPRQFPVFKSKHFIEEGFKVGQKRHIPQEILDKLR
tara:strand:+ start:108 stop:542 length:435 start_codon:yes stop_codon:yes gene_type:complete